jgi:hypothetical protein
MKEIRNQKVRGENERYKKNNNAIGIPPLSVLIQKIKNNSSLPGLPTL